MSFRSELISICVRVSAAAVISYVSIKYIVRFLDPSYALKQEAKKRVEELMSLLDIDFPVELNEYELRIATQLVTPNMGVDWMCIGGYENVINELQNRVIKPLHARANGRLPSSSSLLTPARGILLYGPPGCGKTLIARAMAKSARARFIQLDLSSLTDKWYGESQKLASAVFSLAKKLQPCVVFIDEIDAFLRIRQSSDNEATAMMKAQFMSLWDGFDSNNEDAVIVMGATNRPHDLDSAILRRMPTKFFIQLPDETARAKILKTILRNEYVEADIDYGHIASLTKGLSGSDLKEICRLAALSKLEQANTVDESDEWIDPLSVSISQEDLIRAVGKYANDEIHPIFNRQMIIEDTD